MRDRLLLINQYYPPDASATADLARELVLAWQRAGGEVTVLTGRPSYDTDDHGPWRVWRTQIDDGARVITLGSTGFDRARPAGRVVNYLSFGVLVVIATAILRWRPRQQVVLMTDPPFLPALVGPIVGRRAAVWLQDFHPEFGVAAGVLRDGRLVRAWRHALRFALRRAGRVVVLGRDMRRRVIDLGVAPTRVLVACNGWPDGAGPSARCPPPPSDDTDDRPLRILHLGNLGFAVPWETLLRAADGLVDVAELVIVGSGAREAWLAGEAAKRGNVTLRGRVPREQLAALAADADLLLVGVADGVEGTMVPSKTYELLAMGRPLLVVANTDSEPALVARETESGITASPRDPEAIVKAVTVLRREPDRLRTMGERAWRASHGLSRREQTDRIVEALRSS